MPSSAMYRFGAGIEERETPCQPDGACCGDAEGAEGNGPEQWVFPGALADAPILGTYLDRLHAEVREALKLDSEFVLHCLRHTMLTRLGEAGADAFTIMKIAGHSSVTVSQRYVHPTPEGLERAFERLEELNAAKFNKAVGEVAGVQKPVGPLQKSLQPKRSEKKSYQVIEFKR